jgi:hypothetical protein
MDIENPAGATSTSDSIEVSIEGTKVIKTMTRTCKMKDGSTKVIKKVATKEL